MTFIFEDGELDLQRLEKAALKFTCFMSRKGNTIKVCFPDLTEKQEKQLELILFL